MGIKNIIMNGSISVFMFGENSTLIEHTIDILHDFFLKENIRFVDTPKHADVLAVIEPISNKSAETMRLFYDDMLPPKWVVSINPSDCKEKYKSYAVIEDLRKIIPVNTECNIDYPDGKENMIKMFSRLKEIVRNDG